MPRTQTPQRPAPAGSGPRSARRKQRRSVGDVFAALTAIVALLALVVGVPLALVTAIGVPWPQTMPTVSTLQQPIDSGTLLGILGFFVWLAWLQFAFCVLVEVQAEVRGIGLPTRVPLAGGSQALAHRLVATAVLLFTATALIAPSMLSHGSAGQSLPDLSTRPAVTATVQQQASPAAAVPSAHATAAAAVRAEAGRGALHDAAPVHEQETTRTTKLYTVQPPQGRHHESLWEIADRHLGDGRRYREIFELNKDRIQPDGSKLTIASLIRPGWVLRMPADATDVEVVHEHVEVPVTHETTKAPGHETKHAPAVHHQAAQAKAEHHEAAAGSATHVALPHATQARPAAPVVHAVDAVHAADAQDSPSMLMRDLGAASLLSAGLLVALGRRRRQQLWRRAFGTRLPQPDGDGALAEQTILLGAEVQRARALDRGLRALSMSCQASDRVPPTVYGARVSGELIELLLSPAERPAPAPWRADDEGRTWRLSVAEALALPLAADAVLAPYPGLVCVGGDADSRTLVDLEAAQGLVGVAGPEALEVLSAMAAELATNLWSDHIRVTLVGFGSELTVLAPDRVRAVGSLSEVLPALEMQAEETRRALAAAGVGNVLTGRSRGVSGDAWMPHFVFLATVPEGDDLHRLQALARNGRRTATGFVVADATDAAWTLQVGDDDRLRCPALDLDVEAQRLPAAQFAGVVELFRTAAARDGVPYETSPDDPAGAGRALVGLPDLDVPADVELKILGTAQIEAPYEIDEERRAVCTEIVVYLALHPDGAHPTVLGSAVWPRGVTAAVRDSAIARVRDWLGRDSTGRPHVVVGDDGRVRLGAGVRCDLSVAGMLLRLAGRTPGQEAALLGRALTMVRGPLLADRSSSRYGWLAGMGVLEDTAARLADTAHRLAEIRLTAGDPNGAIAAVRAGLLAAPDDQELWQDLLRATHETGDQARMREAVAELRRQSGEGTDRGDDDLHPATEALVDELLPSWRISAV